MLDYAQIEDIVAILRDSRLTEMEVRQGDRALRLRRARAPFPKAPVVSPVLPVETAYGAPGHVRHVPLAVTAGLVGIFHARRDPIAEGAGVSERQVLGQIESMRLMNDCLAPASGRVVAVRVEEGQPVEYGQTLFEIAEEGRE